MSHDPPIAGISANEAAEILGVSRATVYRLVLQGDLPKTTKHQRNGLDREVVEALAIERWRRGHAYWLTPAEAAEVMGITRPRVMQLIAADQLPAVRKGKRWLLRRPQVEVIANARDARKLR